MNFDYLVKIENMSEEGVKAFQGIAKHIEQKKHEEPDSLALLSNAFLGPNEALERFEMLTDSVENIECDENAGRIQGKIKTGDFESIKELFLALHQKLIDVGAKETRAVINVCEENNHYYASYLLESSDDALSTIADSCILNHHEVHEQVISASKGIMEIQAEVYKDLDVELDEDWDWDDIIYPDPDRIMRSGIYRDFFYDNSLTALLSLQEELEEGWKFSVYKY